MLASRLIQRARSLSDTPNSLFISNSDEKNSLWESWKDVYSKITDSSDDYFVKESFLDTSLATQDGPFEWLVDLPADMYKVRFVDYMDSGRWVAMTKFNTNNRNRSSATPSYRMKGKKLWLIGNALPSQVRITYYPPPIEPSVPDLPYSYCGSYAAYDVSTKVSDPFFFTVPKVNQNDADYMLYVYNKKSIKIESTMFQSVATLYTSLTDVSTPTYFGGFVYFMTAGAIYRASTDFTSTLVPTSIVADPVTSFSIQDNQLFYSTASATYMAQLDGTVATEIYAYAATRICVISPDPNATYVLASDGYVKRNGTSIGVKALALSSDGTHLYIVNESNELMKIVYVDGTQWNQVYLADKTTVIGYTFCGFLPTIDQKFMVRALSTSEDTEFDYPVNEANEIMAYQCAIDFKRKQNGDFSALQLRLGEIMTRFLSVIIRDSYQPERRSPEQPTSYYF